MKRVFTRDLNKEVGREINLSGFIDVRRDHGKLIFFDVRDMSGKVQCVALPTNKDAHAIASTMRPEWVIEVTGKVNSRPEKMVNKDEANGDIEVEVTDIKILNEAKTPPIDTTGDGFEINEEARLKYRYLDLRRPRLARNIRARHKVIKFIRDFLDERQFIEIETPILTKSTPEGARDYIVPSRLDKGKFYALPQSPQQYKQLLMTAGFERYFQIARCMRDEDTRGDRQPEFSQLDLEMSYVDREDVMRLNEELLIAIVENLFPEKRIQEIPFPRITYKEAIKQYGTDRPDLRKDPNDKNVFAFCWIIDFPFFEKDKAGQWTFTHNPFSAPKPEHLDWLMNGENIGDILTTQYDIALNGYEIVGGSIRNHKSEALFKVMEILGHSRDAVLKNFGHMIHAFESGTPPHGGIAWGLERLIMILLGEPNIREVIAFPKTGEGRDPMMDSPSEISPDQLKELGLKLI